MANLKRLLGLIACLCLVSLATASVRTLPVTQYLHDPANPSSPNFSSSAVAIDGDSIIVVTDSDTQRSALLYRRGATGQWAFERYLLRVPLPTNTDVRAAVAMKNFIAVIKLDEVVTIWEKQSGNWVQAATDAVIRQPGRFAISTDRVMVGADGCTDDALMYQKSATTGRWGITGRIPRQAGICAPNQVRDIELNYDNALVRTGSVLRGYRRNGSNVAWPASFTLNVGSISDGPPAMQSNVIVLPGGNYYRLSSSGLTRLGDLIPLNAANGAGSSNAVLYRDGQLLSTEWTEGYRTVARINLWTPNSSGGFDQAALLDVDAGGGVFDISHNTVVAALEDYFTFGTVGVFEIPTPPHAPRPIVNNFETGDVSGIDMYGPQRYSALSQDGRNTTLHHFGYGESRNYAVWHDSAWPFSQQMTARIDSPVARAYDPSISWVGLALRFADERNTYVGYVTGTNVARIVAVVNGQEFTLAEQQLAAFPQGRQLVFSIVGNQLSFQAGPDNYLSATDSRLKAGRAGVVLNRTSGNFDDVIVAPTTGFSILYRNYNGDLTYGPPLTQVGGTWVVPSDGEYYLQQTNTTQQGLYLGGTPTHDQTVSTEMRLDRFGSTNPVAWIGLVARYVDARTFYYLSVRSTGQLQIRKIVNGVTTVLAAKAYAPAVGEFHKYKFEVIGGELRAYADDTLIASVRDSEIPTGRYGVGSYRAAASWKYISVIQP
ncbi:MAG TPA: hypothetical protein VM146_12590 [Steroidobacteraceae bacterium]|nr:hypothetical protein [Steroidobacteraceae bacterium]